jgi:DNA polymerase-3 subunit epsilon
MSGLGGFSDRDRLREQIGQLLDRDDVFILDTETTGLKNAEVIEVAIIDTHGTVLLDTLVKPRSSVMNPHAQRVHGITPEMLLDQPDWTEVFPVLRAILDRGTVLAWNASFDARMLKLSSEAWDLTHSRFLFVCAMRLYARLFGRRAYGLHRAVTDARLDHLLEVHSSHRALGDVNLVRELLQVASQGWSGADNPQLP